MSIRSLKNNEDLTVGFFTAKPDFCRTWLNMRNVPNDICMLTSFKKSVISQTFIIPCPLISYFKALVYTNLMDYPRRIKRVAKTQKSTKTPLMADLLLPNSTRRKKLWQPWHPNQTNLIVLHKGSEPFLTQIEGRFCTCKGGVSPGIT